jgi:hypothetical protein
MLTAQQFHGLCIDIWTEPNKLANIYNDWNILQKYYLRSLGLSLFNLLLVSSSKSTSKFKCLYMFVRLK